MAVQRRRRFTPSESVVTAGNATTEQTRRLWLLRVKSIPLPQAEVTGKRAFNVDRVATYASRYANTTPNIHITWKAS